MKHKPPIIGLTLDWRPSGQYSKYPWYAIRQNYGDCLQEEGALPLHLPFYPTRVEEYLNQVDGILVTGGDFDIDPALYGEKITSERVTPLPSRTEFEYSLIQQALKRDMPILGICGGAQLINVVLGGSLIQHIPDAIQSSIAHEQPNPRNEPSHGCEIKNKTLLYRIVGQTSLNVNSAHHQAVNRLGKGVVTNAQAPDGIIEGIEVPSYKFCLGIQWHPEYLVSAGDRKIFQAFVSACQSI